MKLVKKLRVILFISLFVLMACECCIADDPPFPGIPHAFWGTVTYESGENVSDGTIVLAVVDGENYNTTIVNGTYGYYTPFHVEDPEDDNQGLQISFFVDGVFTGQKVSFESGTTRLNLTVSEISDDNDNSGGGSQNSGGGGSPPPAKASPVAEISAKTYAFVNVSTVFDALNSTDSDGDIVTYSWNFGDGSVGSGVKVNHLFNTTGTFTVSLLVTDDDALTDVDEISVSVMVDSDADEWGDEEEEDYGTDPENATDFPLDSDNDHLPDEIDTDDDNDGVIDTIELELGSDYLNEKDVVMINGTDAGYLVDVDDDMAYDFYVDSSTEDYVEIEIDEEGFYLLDLDFDGNIDHKYMVETGELVEYQQPFNLMYIGIIILVIIIVGSLVLFMQYRSKKSDKSEEEK